MKQRARGLRQSQHRGSEDDRHDAAGVYAQRQVGRLAAHDLAADDALGVLHRNTALAAFDKHNERDHHDHQHHQQQDRRNRERAPGLVLHLVPEVGYAARQADYDAGEDQQRHAVADAALGDLLAQPHDEDAARGQGQHGHQDETDARVVDEGYAAAQRLPLQGDGDAQRLHRAQAQRQIAGPLGDLLAAQFAFLLQLGQRLVNHGHQLQNDGCRDVRHDAQGEDRQAAQLAATEQVNEAKEAAAVLVEELGEQDRR